MALPTTFIIFISMLTFIEVFASPILLYMAAPELYIASIGKLIAVIIRYCLLASNTSLSIFPKSKDIRGCANTTVNTVIISETVKVISSSWAAAIQASSFFLAPINWLIITAPPVASAASKDISTLFTISTSDTPDTAASPAKLTITVSDIPTITARNCSIINGIINSLRSLLVKSFPTYFLLSCPIYSPIEYFFTSFHSPINTLSVVLSPDSNVRCH